MLLEMQVTLEKLTEPMHTKHCRDSEGPLTDSTIDFTCNLAATDADIWGWCESSIRQTRTHGLAGMGRIRKTQTGWKE